MYFTSINQTRSARTALLALFLTLWLGLAFIDHQFDTIVEHHKHHDCQLFHSIQTGLKSAVLAVQPLVTHGFVEPDAETIRISRPLRAYLARSPPITVLRMNP